MCMMSFWGVNNVSYLYLLLFFDFAESTEEHTIIV